MTLPLPAGPARRAPRPTRRAAAVLAAVVALGPALGSAAGAAEPPSTAVRVPATAPLGAAARAAPVTEAPGSSTTPDARYRVPVPGGVLRAFDPPAVRWGSGHRGVDLAASAGDVVRAPAAGVVAFAGSVAGRRVLTLQHDDGLRSSFEPVTTDLRVGDRVRVGDAVATLDAAGPGGHCLPRSCLHWGVRRGETYLDPMALVASDPIVLLPLG
ncbi:murein hydrolase activator EnvC family protein [Luteimicrobium sp. NPDC057192]|uniref:murein hydrolase activator EnvC family protein n=1 Tax=Luteimicrobium sp. NPDC057192 TaxID=3346042 RepID=UPI0036369107